MPRKAKKLVANEEVSGITITSEVKTPTVHVQVMTPDEALLYEEVVDPWGEVTGRTLKSPEHENNAITNQNKEHEYHSVILTAGPKHNVDVDVNMEEFLKAFPMVEMPEIKANEAADEAVKISSNLSKAGTITFGNAYVLEPNEDVKKKIEYKYNEDNFLKEIGDYINSTYTAHYSGKYQATDMIIDAGHGTGFCIGSIMKYAKRYGKKDGYNRKDLLKIIHYAIIQLYNQDNNNL